MVSSPYASMPTCNSAATNGAHPLSVNGYYHAPRDVLSDQFTDEGSDDSGFVTPPSPPPSPHLAVPHGTPTPPPAPCTVVNITVHANSAPVTVHTGEHLPSAPPTTAPCHHHVQRALAIQSPSVRASQSTASPHSSAHSTPGSMQRASTLASVPSTPTRRPHRPDHAARSGSVAPETSARLPGSHRDAMASARRLREIQEALEQVALEQNAPHTVAPAMQPSQPVPTVPPPRQAVRAPEANVATAIRPEDEHIDPPERFHRRWYVVLVGKKVGIWKNYAQMSQYILNVSHAIHQSVRSREEAEDLYFGSKARGEVHIL
ncbi:hypothetical protein C8Q80DRAFT_948996 [Daedaleopsis nitida]|nr:hypothetical protein C8Q80DRAFT_948996 [Daedaleopsis nitida]